MLYLYIFKILKIWFWTFWMKICSVLTAIISKAMIKFLSKFHVQIHWYRFTRDNRFLLNPSQSTRNSSSSAFRHINNSLSVCLLPDSELNNRGTKIQGKWAFKSYFCHQKNKTRKQKSSAGNFLQHPIQVCRGAYIPYYKINAPIFCCSIFFEECVNPQVRTNKMSFRINFTDTHSHISIDSSGIYFPTISWIFSQTCISHHGCG